MHPGEHQDHFQIDGEALRSVKSHTPFKEGSAEHGGYKKRPTIDRVEKQKPNGNRRRSNYTSDDAVLLKLRDFFGGAARHNRRGGVAVNGSHNTLLSGRVATPLP